MRTAEVLGRLGYDYFSFEIPPELPEISDIRFGDLIPGLEKSDSPICRRIAGQRLYMHQVRAMEALRRGENLVLKSGTGSGKTEAWFLRVALDDVSALAVYPTLALANDQLNRLREYGSALGFRVMALDAVKRDELVKSIGYRGLRREIAESRIVITNPAFLLNELKKMGAGKASLLRPFLEKAGMIVIDDFDFYGPRSIALLFSMIKLLLRLTNPGMQLAFMTAALANPEEVAEYLTSINGRKTVIVDGKPFHPRNLVYIVLGKSLTAVWERVRAALADKMEMLGDDVRRALSDFQQFKRYYFRVLDAARGLGVEIPDASLDVAEILEHYLEDEGVTIVFTRNIARAEEIARRVRLRAGEGAGIASHHHLLSKRFREEVEEGARAGRIRVIVSPRTLSQGIDIGLVKRVVHVGLPDSLREFKQREGRKGRRLEIEETETVIIPQGAWDHELLSRGVEALRKWMELPQEKVIVNRDNMYGRLFEALFKYVSPSLRQELTQDELRLLRELGLESDGELTRRGKMTWLKMNFYEFAPAYGIKRIRVSRLGDQEYLEDVSHVDLVEKFQIGCIDYSSDGVVVEHKLGGRGSRTVTAVYVEDLSEGVLRRHDALAQVLEEYEKAKWKWGERPDLRRDYFAGKIHTDVRCVVHAPSNGFGLYTKIPNRAIWRIISDRRLIKVIGERTIAVREGRTIEVPAPTNGIYSDYTYGISFEVSPDEDPELLRLGLAFLIIALRRILGVAFDTIKYDIMIMGERKVVGMHETESAGLLPKIDWQDLAEKIRGYEPDELDEVFLEEVDELAYSSFITLKLDWDLVKRQALKILDYLLLRERLRVELAGRSITIPKPSRALKLASIAAASILLREDLRSGLYGVAIFDGEEALASAGFYELGAPDQSHSSLLTYLNSLIDQGFSIIVYDLRAVGRALEEAGLASLKIMLEGLRASNRLIEAGRELVEALGEPVSLELFEELMGLEKKVRLQDLIYAAEEEKRRIPRISFLRSIPRRLAQRLTELLEAEARSAYLAHLVAGELRGARS
jgi:DEAD/DEAH box helicase domain-containing protein